MANNAEKSLHPEAYLNFRKEGGFSRWVAIWFDFHPQLLWRSFPQQLFFFPDGFKLCSSTPFSESMCFLKTLLNYCLLEVWNYVQCHSRWTWLFLVMDAKREERRKKNPTFPWCSVLLSCCWIHCFDSFMRWQTFKHAVWEFKKWSSHLGVTQWWYTHRASI